MSSEDYAETSATGASLLTQEAEDAGPPVSPASEKIDGETATVYDATDENAHPADLVPEKPEGYALSFAEGVNLDPALLDGFKNMAHKLGIAQGQAQKLADFYAGHAAASAEKTGQAQAAALLEAKKGWEEEITARPGFKREVLDAKRTLKEFGSQELNELMDQSLLGSHPVFFDFVVRVGKALAEPEVRGSGAGGGKDMPLAARLWPNM